MAEEKKRRPHHDETESLCHSHSLYSRFFTGRPGDPVAEEPKKYTHYDEHMAATIEGPHEYEIRFFESQQLSTAMKEGFWSKEELGKVMTYLSFPPVFVARLGLDPAAEILLFGRSVDVTFVDTCIWSLQVGTYFPDYHYEDGYITNCFQFDEEFGYELRERRHLRVGEKLKDIQVTRPASEGGMLARDIFLDVRNEMMPEYAASAYHIATWVAAGIMLWHDTANMEGVSIWYHGLNSLKLGWPYKSVNLEMHPRPPALDVMAQNPPNIFVLRFNGLLMGPNYGTRYWNTPAEYINDTYGTEYIPATDEEFAYRMIRYGMDRYELPPTWKESKWLYGDEARRVPPTEHIFEARDFIHYSDARKRVETARKEHPEWLVR